MLNCNDDDDIAEKSPDQRYIRYREILARGAYKIVYKGFDEVDGIEIAWNQVSIKDVFQCPENLEKLRSELHLLKTLKHENIIKSYMSWVDPENKTINLITELFTSGSLRQYRHKHRTVDVKAIKNWARQILRGLRYLHSQNPPIIHRDLNCDNIFINGNHGDVKIGTPEFMASKLCNDEEYNELVDIYSFGMCMLELATCQSTFSECKNAVQIFEEATSGVKPAALSKVKDPLIKQFIERCLVPASQQLSAAELLNHPFLSSGSSKEVVCAASSHKSEATPKVDNLPSSGHISVEVDPKLQNIPGGNITESMKSASQLSSLEIRRHKIRLLGVKDNDSISITLRNSDLHGMERIEFTFNLHEDTALSVAAELAQEFTLPKDVMEIIYEMISDLLLKLVPSCKPSVGTSESSNSCKPSVRTSESANSCKPSVGTSESANSCKPSVGTSESANSCKPSVGTSESSNSCKPSVGTSESSNSCKPSIGTSESANSLYNDSHENKLSTSSVLNQESSGISTDALIDARSSITGANNFGECSKEITTPDDMSSNVSRENTLSTSSALNQESSDISTEALVAARSSTIGADDLGECSKEIPTSDDMSSNTPSSSSLIEGYDEEALCNDFMKLELDTTEVQYQRRCCDLTRQRQEAIEKLRRWISKQKSSPVSCK